MAIKINWDNVPNMYLGTYVRCSTNNMKKFNKIFNQNNMSALDNYASKNNLAIYFTDMENDLFDNTKMCVGKFRCLESDKSYTMNLNQDNKQKFSDSIKLIYKNVEDVMLSVSILIFASRATISLFFNTPAGFISIIKASFETKVLNIPLINL